MADELRLSPVPQAMAEAGLRRQLDARYGRTRLLSRIQLRDYLEAHERTMYERYVRAQARKYDHPVYTVYTVAYGHPIATVYTGAGDEFLAARDGREDGSAGGGRIQG